MQKLFLIWHYASPMAHENFDRQKLTTPTRALSWHSMLTLYFSLVVYAVIYNYLLLKENLTEGIIMNHSTLSIVKKL